ncbi:MAG: tRNA pseudouridine synthase A [Chloroflexi bacterium]|nr:tRNA pseudouridine synthase A [Chloroflexota bacterium]
MERYQVILAYDGAGFLGSQRQTTFPPDGRSRTRTVQGELERALQRIGWEGRSILLAGRTDTGTHASGQVAAFDLDWAHGTDELVKALNANLPQDMAVRSARKVTRDFHPRFDALSRRYRYRLFCQEGRDPLRERYAWRVWPEVTDLAPLADLWTGRHDFSAFGTPPRPGGGSVRTVFEAGWRRVEDDWIFEISADAFLYRMVRRLVFVQVAVGQGRLPVRQVLQALAQQAGCSHKLPAGLAPACGLALVEVCYDNLGS